MHQERKYENFIIEGKEVGFASGKDGPVYLYYLSADSHEYYVVAEPLLDPIFFKIIYLDAMSLIDDDFYNKQYVDPLYKRIMRILIENSYKDLSVSGLKFV